MSSKKQTRRNLRHARIGESSTRPALTLDRMKSRLICIEFQLSEDEEPVEIFFRPIPSSRVMSLQGLGGKSAIEAMLEIVAEFVVDPQTGKPLAGRDDWDSFGVDGIQAIVSAMVDGARGGKGRGDSGSGDDTEAGPTTPAAQDAMTQAALEMMQGDPEMAAAFRKAAEVISAQVAEQEKGGEKGGQEGQEEQEGQAETATTEVESETETHTENPESLTLTPTPTPTASLSAPNGMSGETH